MPKSKKPRRAYQPLGRPNINPLYILQKNSRATLSYDQVRVLIIDARSSLDNCLNGIATYNDLENIGVASNIAMLLCEAGIGREFMDSVKRAQGVIVNAMFVFNTTGVIPKPEDQGAIDALVEMLDLHDQQIAHESFTAGVMHEVLVELTARKESGNIYQVTA